MYSLPWVAGSLRITWSDSLVQRCNIWCMDEHRSPIHQMDTTKLRDL